MSIYIHEREMKNVATFSDSWTELVFCIVEARD